MSWMIEVGMDIEQALRDAEESKCDVIFASSVPSRDTTTVAYSKVRQ